MTKAEYEAGVTISEWEKRNGRDMPDEAKRAAHGMAYWNDYSQSFLCMTRSDARECNMKYDEGKNNYERIMREHELPAY